VVYTLEFQSKAMAPPTAENYDHSKRAPGSLTILSVSTWDISKLPGRTSHRVLDCQAYQVISQETQHQFFITSWLVNGLEGLNPSKSRDWKSRSKESREDMWVGIG
jgi:hypothetical protein